MTKNKTYDESDIVVLQGLESVRVKFGMYIGNNDSTGIWQILKEVIQNCLDEALQGRGKSITIIIDSKNSKFLVADSAEGIPIGIHKKTKISTLTTILTTLHAGGKINADNSAYAKGSSGTFGVGVSVTNALSKIFKAYTCRDGQWYFQSFAEGKETSKVKKVSKSDLPKVPNFSGKGTIIEFEADEKIFKKHKFQPKEPLKWIDNIAYFYPQLKWTLVVDGKKTEFQYKDGIVALVQSWLAKSKLEPYGKPFSYVSSNLTCAMQWAASDDEKMTYYVNSLEVNLGTHATALNKIITDTFRKYATKKQEFKPEDVRVGLFGILNISITSPAFSGQTKERLISPEAADLVKSTLTKEFEAWALKNKTFVKELIARAVDLGQAEAKFKADRKFAAKLKTTVNGRTLLPTNLSTSITNDPTKRELFIIEGESAKGTSVLARDAQFQEILPLQGKILNVLKSSDDKIGANKGVEQVLQAIGYNPNLKNPFEKMRVNKIMLLSDADDDGCLDGNTKILTYNKGCVARKTIKSLANHWEKHRKAFDVLSVNSSGRFIIAKAMYPRKTVIRNQECIITLASGLKLRSTIDHLYMIKRKPLEFKEAKDFKEGDFIQGFHASRYQKITSIKIVDCKPKQFYCMTVPETGNFFITDNDGNVAGSSNCHINLLLSGLIFKVLRPLIEQGRVYSVDLPLYTAPLKNSRVYGYKLKEIIAKLPPTYNKDQITRMKGLGESLHPKTIIGDRLLSTLNNEPDVATILGQNSNFELIPKTKTEIGTVLTKAGFLMCNPNHPILIFRNWDFEFVNASQIQQGDYLLTKLNRTIYGEFAIRSGEYLYPKAEIAQILLPWAVVNNRMSWESVNMDVCLDHVDAPIRASFSHTKPTMSAIELIAASLGVDPSQASRDFLLSTLQERFFAIHGDDFTQKVLTLMSAEAILGLSWTPFIKSEFFDCPPMTQYDISITKNKMSLLPDLTDNTFMANNFVVHNCNPDVLREIAFNEKTRKLIQLQSVDGKHAKRFLSTLNEDVAFRREILGLDNAEKT